MLLQNMFVSFLDWPSCHLLALAVPHHNETQPHLHFETDILELICQNVWLYYTKSFAMAPHFIHPFPKPEHGSSLLHDGHVIEGARAQLRAMLIEGAVSPKTTLLNDSFIEKLRQESKKRMGL